jgi:hypothetical protein
MTLQLPHSEFPYIQGKFDLLFISAGFPAKGKDSGVKTPLVKTPWGVLRGVYIV